MADRARSAAERALALDPQHPEGYRALGTYYRLVDRPADARRRAVHQGPRPRARATPTSSAASASPSRRWASGSGRWSTSGGAGAWIPASATAGALGDAAALAPALRRGAGGAGRGARARAGVAALGRGQGHGLLARGDLAGARAVLAQPPAGVDLPTFVAYVANYWDLYWVLDPTTSARWSSGSRPPPSTATRGPGVSRSRALYEVEGDRRRAAAYADSARVAIEQQLTATPDDAQRQCPAGPGPRVPGPEGGGDPGGRTGSGARAGQRAMPVSGTYFQHQLVRIYILVGRAGQGARPARAAAQDPVLPLARLAPDRSHLRSDPEHPRFERLAGTSP